MPAISVDLSSSLIKTIDNISQQLVTNRNRIIQEALNEYIEKLEDEQDAKECEEAIRDFIASGEKGITSEEIHRKYNI